MRAKPFLCHVGKRLGLFVLASFLNRRKLPILCYHGFAFTDESAFRPKLFMEPASFGKRMEHLRRRGYRVLSLEEGMDRLRKGTLPRRALVITIDDGFYGVHRHAMPVLKEHSFPATLYVTSYYVEKRNPVFRLVVQYMFWKTRKPSLDLSGLVPGASGRVDLSNPTEHKSALTTLTEYGETRCDEPGRRALAELLGEKLDVDYAQLLSSRALSLMTVSELQELLANGIDIQLHTHRHQFPENHETACRELADNHQFLKKVSDRPLRHFCYPSGLWSKAHWPWLSEFGILTATTCDAGLNSPDTPPFELRRFLDGENISQIEFEAELCGFTELLRNARRLRRRSGSEGNPIHSEISSAGNSSQY